ncbi:restriction endonuclease subunit S [Bifidobacterium mongoliense]|uniref:restriction endonuclease subunit S n=1 Tax=Bifidobacterium mongoliense TaxID=518643 RepID=UPI0030EF05F5
MTDDTSRVPKLRFPGFAGAWEQRKLRDYLVPSKEKNSALSYGKDEVLSVSGDAGVVNQIQFQGRSYAGASTKDYGVVQTGDVIYTKSPLKKNPFGIIKTNKGKAGIVSTLYAVYKPKDNTYTPFVEVYFDDDARLNNYLRPLVNKGAKNDMKVSKSGALTGLICFPGATEQRMLSEFFQQLEDLITLHRRKLSHLRQLKKGLLQKMFPKSGEDRPEVRFPGFVDAWEQRKLGGVTDILTGFPFQSQKFSNVGTPLIRGANVKRGYLDLSVNNTVYWGNVHGLERYFLSENDIVIQMDGALIGKSYACIRKENLPSLLVQRVARLRSKGTFPAFIYQSIQRGFLVYIKRKKTETAVPHLSSFDIHNFRITIPSLSEQQRIGIFFGQLDDLITLHQRKLSHLQQQKKALLQQMFV